MKKFFTVYTKTDCSFCKKAVSLLDERKLPFIVVVMDKNPEFLEKVKKDMKHDTVPIVIEHINIAETKVIGGSDNLEAYLNSTEFVRDWMLIYSN